MDMDTEQSSIISKFGTWLFIVDIRSKWRVCFNADDTKIREKGRESGETLSWDFLEILLVKFHNHGTLFIKGKLNFA